MRPKRFEWEGEKDCGPGHVGHDAREGFRWLAHRPRDKDGEAEVEKYDDNQGANENFLVRLPRRHGSHMVSGDVLESSSSFWLVADVASPGISENWNILDRSTGPIRYPCAILSRRRPMHLSICHRH